jgi:hypothetical protein
MLLKKLAQESGHQELVDAPLLFWGHSAAAGFGGTFAAIHPERTIALVNYQGGGGTRVNMKVLSRIPSLYLAGGKDDATALANTLDMWKSGRSTGALWTFAIQPDATHGDNEFLKKANDLMIPWIAAVLRQRLSPDGKTLRAVTDASGWLGNNGTGTVAPSSAFIGSKAEASWLPDEATARGWQVVTGLGTAK